MLLGKDKTTDTKTPKEKGQNIHYTQMLKGILIFTVRQGQRHIFHLLSSLKHTRQGAALSKTCCSAWESGTMLRLLSPLTPTSSAIQISKPKSSCYTKVLSFCGSSGFLSYFSDIFFSSSLRFKTDFVEELPKGSSHFDIICSHMRLDLDELKRLMPQTSIYISILRDPVQTFESVFSYYTYYVPAFSLAKKSL